VIAWSQRRLPQSNTLCGCALAALLAFGSSAATAADAAEPASTLTISNPKIRALIPGQDTTAGYFDITNSGTTAVTLVGATSPHARSIEIHTIIRDGDMVRMRRLDTVTIEPGATEVFATGGTHLMLFGVERLAAVNRIDLITAGGKRISGRFRLIPLGAEG
jgi:copper(I)-binding protein